MSNLLSKQSSPMTASVHWEPKDDSFEDRVAWYTLFLTQPLKVRYGLLHSKVAEAIISLGRKYEIVDPERLGEISRIVREIFTDRISGQKISRRATEKLRISPAKTETFLENIKNIVLLVKKTGEEEYEEEFEEMPVIPALKKYEKLAEQEITFGNLRAGEEKMVVPTVKNWINDYILRKGAQAHSALERSDYLYNSQNTRELTFKERKRLTEILESYDEDKNLIVQREVGEVYFVLLDKESEKMERGSEGGIQFQGEELEQKRFEQKPNREIEFQPKQEQPFEKQGRNSLESGQVSVVRTPSVGSVRFESAQKNDLEKGGNYNERVLESKQGAELSENQKKGDWNEDKKKENTGSEEPQNVLDLTKVS